MGSDQKRKIDIHGLPMELGLHYCGADMGPRALRVAGLIQALKDLGLDVCDKGDVSIKTKEMMSSAGDPKRRYWEEIVQVCDQIECLGYDSLTQGRTPIFLGGDHSISMGSVEGVFKYHAAKSQKVGVIWFDAHADMNTPLSTNSGNVHGMSLAALLRLGPFKGQKPDYVDPKNVWIVGARDLDTKEKDIVREAGVNIITMKELDKLGVYEAGVRAIAGASEGTAGIHVSFDLDVLDPKIGPGVSTPVRGGITYREAHLLCELLADSQKVLSVDMVELNPICDHSNVTAHLAVELLQSLFGKRILS